jgi:Asp-tRNA(Asn)/Glu-tRNA(Gln) amidotransferase A subunit family amidase
MDHVGPLCRSVADAGIVYDALLGRPAQNRAPRVWTGVKGLRIGVLRGYFTSLLDAHVAQHSTPPAPRCRSRAQRSTRSRFRTPGDIAPIYLHIVLAEAAAIHAKTLDSHAEHYTPNVRIRLEMGRYILAEDYVRALRGRHLLIEEVDAALRGRDALLLPSLAVPASQAGRGHGQSRRRRGARS